MKWFLSTILTAVLFSACTPDPKASAVAEGEYADIPPGALREPFADQPGMERLVLRNSEGKLQFQGTLLNGKRVGVWAEYHANGMLRLLTPYVEGKREGTFAEFTPTGQLLRRIDYHNDLRHGEYREFEYSIVKEERTYVADKVEGTARVYYPSGKVMEEGQYKNGTRHGLSRWYDQEGNLSIEYEYREGQLIKK